jgi:hypothetical protein
MVAGRLCFTSFDFKKNIEVIIILCFKVLDGVLKRDTEVDPVLSLKAWVIESNDGLEPDEQEQIFESTKELWLEICGTLQTEHGALLIERVKEDKTMIVADMTTREIAEKKTRRDRGSGGASSLADAMACLERNSMSTSDSISAQAELRAKLEEERLKKQDAWKQKEVRRFYILDIASTLYMYMYCRCCCWRLCRFCFCCCF